VHLDILRQDLAYTARLLRRTPGFAVTAVLNRGARLGATTAAFSVTDFVLIRPLPFPDAERLVKIWETTPGYARMELSAPNYRDWKAAATSFESMGTYHSEAVTITNAGEPRRFLGSSVSADLLPTLGVTPIIGALHTTMIGGCSWHDDSELPPLADGVRWRPDCHGRNLVAQVDFDDTPYTVIGVMPREFHFPKSDVLFWITTRFGEGAYQAQERTNNWLEAVGRIRRGTTLSQARARNGRDCGAIAAAIPKENKDTGPPFVEMARKSRSAPAASARAFRCGRLRAVDSRARTWRTCCWRARWHADASSRLRTAIGAGRERLVRQTDDGEPAARVGGRRAGDRGCGRFGAAPRAAGAGDAADRGLAIGGRPRAAVCRRAHGAHGHRVRTGARLRAGASPDLDGLREGSRTGGAQKERLRSALVVAEIVASVVLLVTAGLLIRALLAIQAIDPGFKPDGVLTMRTELPMPE